MTSFNEQWGEFEQWLDQFLERDPLAFFESMRMLYRWTYKWWLIVRLNRAGVLIMARGKGTQTQGKAQPKGNWTTFVDIPVTAADEKKINAAYGVADEVFNAMASLLEDGYRVSFSYNPANDAMICTVTCKLEGDPNDGCTFTAFAGDWYTALRVAMYKHFHVAKGVWRGAEGAAARPAFG